VAVAVPKGEVVVVGFVVERPHPPTHPHLKPHHLCARRSALPPPPPPRAQKDTMLSRQNSMPNASFLRKDSTRGSMWPDMRKDSVRGGTWGDLRKASPVRAPCPAGVGGGRKQRVRPAGRIFSMGEGGGYPGFFIGFFRRTAVRSHR